MARRGTGLHFSWVWKASETEVVTRDGKEGRERERQGERKREEERLGGGGVAGRAGDFARRVIVKLSSIYFTNLHITSAVVAASQRKVRNGWTRGTAATRRVSSATYVCTYVSTCTERMGEGEVGRREDCMFCYRPERGCRRRPTLWLQPRPTYDVRTRW